MHGVYSHGMEFDDLMNVIEDANGVIIMCMGVRGKKGFVERGGVVIPGRTSFWMAD